MLKVLSVTMDNNGHVSPGEEAARPVEATKARRGRSRKSSARENVVPEPATDKIIAEENAAEETATRERSLLRATLRVWELKHRISD